MLACLSQCLALYVATCLASFVCGCYDRRNRRVAEAAGRVPHRVDGNGPVYGRSGDAGLPLIHHELSALHVYDNVVSHCVGRVLGQQPQALVVDVGAHLGLFARLVLQQHSGARVVAIEAIPELADFCRQNTAGCGRGRCMVETAAVGNPGLCAATAPDVFTAFEYSPGLSCASAAAVCIATSKRHTAQLPPVALLRAALLDFSSCGILPFPGAVGVFCAMLGVPYLGACVCAVAVPVLLVLLCWVAGSAHPPTILQLPVVLLEDVVEKGITALRLHTNAADDDGEMPCIHLLKLTVEGGELDILQSGSAAFWGRVRAVCVEVHDFEGRIETASRVLASRGFQKIHAVKKPYAVHTLLGEVNLIAERA